MDRPDGAQVGAAHLVRWRRRIHPEGPVRIGNPVAGHIAIIVAPPGGCARQGGARRWAVALPPMTAYRIAVIGGDGVGPEVTTVALEAMRVAGSRFGFNIADRPVRPRRGPLPANRRGASGWRGRGTGRARRHPPRGGGHTHGPSWRSRTGASPPAPVRLRPLRQPPPSQALPGCRIADRRADTAAARPGGRPREHRRPVRRRRGRPPPRNSSRDSHPGIAQHLSRGGAGHPIRVRSRRAEATQGDPLPQDQRAHLGRRPVAADSCSRSGPTTPRSSSTMSTSMPPVYIW